MPQGSTISEFFIGSPISPPVIVPSCLIVILSIVSKTDDESPVVYELIRKKYTYKSKKLSRNIMFIVVLMNENKQY